MLNTDNKEYNMPKVVSLFSGCGGLDLGFKQAGHEIVWSNDINPDACSTYRRNIGEIHEGNIYDFEIPEINELDVLTAGFPCQPFSNAGNRQGINDTRGKLYQVCLRYIEHLNPKIVLLENVRGLLSIQGHHGRLIQEICEDLSFLDYEVHFKLIDATTYGVPQHRLRLIIVGVKKNLVPHSFRFPTPVDDVDLSLGSCLDVPPDTPNQNDLLRLNPQALYLGSLVPEGGSWKDIPYDLLPERLKKIRDDMRKYRWPNFYRRFHRNEIAGTVTAAFKPENAGVWHPIESRVLSAREIARIQTFPDDFVFVGKNTKAIYEMIGNAVPPKLSYTFACLFKDILKNKIKECQFPVKKFSELNLNKKPIRPSDLEIIYDFKNSRNVERFMQNTLLDSLGGI